LSGRGLCDELITRPEESYRLCCVVVCDLETSRIGVPYIYDISCLRVKKISIKRSSINYSQLLGVVSRRADQQFSSVMESKDSHSQEHFTAFTSDLVKPSTKHHTEFFKIRGNSFTY